MQEVNAYRHPAIAANAQMAGGSHYTPPLPTGTPEWVTKLKEQRPHTWDVRIVQMALDLFDYNDGIFWCEGHEGLDQRHGTSTDAAYTPFYREAWIDALPNGEYQLVTDKVCAIGSIQLLIGGGDDNADYQTIIERLNVISQEKFDQGIVPTNDGYGRHHVKEVMQEYVKRHGGKEGMILPDFKPVVRFDKVGQQYQDNDEQESE